MHHDKYIELVYNWKSEYASIPDLQLRKQTVADKLGITIPEKIDSQVLDYLNQQSPYRHRLLVSRQELLDEMILSLRNPIANKGEDAELKYVKLKGDIDALCGRLVDDIEKDFKVLYGELSEVAKEQGKVRSVEQRLKEKK